MKVSTSVTDNQIAVIAIEGEVDAHTAGKLDRALKDALERGHARLLLDASGMDFISSSGLRVIVAAQREAGQSGGGVRLFGLQPQVLRAFEIAGFDEFLRLAEGREEAMEGW
jgi:anti-sigma B factor antagonist